MAKSHTSMATCTPNFTPSPALLYQAKGYEILFRGPLTAKEIEKVRLEDQKVLNANRVMREEDQCSVSLTLTLTRIPVGSMTIREMVRGMKQRIPLSSTQVAPSMCQQIPHHAHPLSSPFSDKCDLYANLRR